MKLLILLCFSLSLLAQNVLKTYTPEGRLLQVSINNLENSNEFTKELLSTPQKIYYKTAQLHFEVLHISPENILLKEYYKSGKIKLEIMYKKGKKDGSAKSYFQDGTLSASASFVNDKVDGRYDEYYRNGKMHFQKHYIEGILDGPIIEYDESGNKTYKLDYTNAVEVCY